MWLNSAGLAQEPGNWEEPASRHCGGKGDRELVTRTKEATDQVSGPESSLTPQERYTAGEIHRRRDTRQEAGLQSEWLWSIHLPVKRGLFNFLLRRKGVLLGLVSYSRRLSIYLSNHLSIYLSIIYLSSIYLSSVYLSITISLYLSILSIYHVCIYLPISISIIYVCIYLFLYLLIYMFMYMMIYMYISHHLLRYFLCSHDTETCPLSDIALQSTYGVTLRCRDNHIEIMKAIKQNKNKPKMCPYVRSVRSQSVEEIAFFCLKTSPLLCFPSLWRWYKCELDKVSSLLFANHYSLLLF